MELRPQLFTSCQWCAQLVTLHLIALLGVQLQPSFVQFLLIEDSSLKDEKSGTKPDFSVAAARESIRREKMKILCGVL